MAEIRIGVTGVDEFEAKLRQLSLALQAQILVDIATAGAEIVRAEAQRNAPIGETGLLAENMTLRVNKESDINEASVDVGPDREQFYGYWVEMGSIHNAPAKPFLRNALEDKRSEVTDIIVQKMWQIVRDIGDR